MNKIDVTPSPSATKERKNKRKKNSPQKHLQKSPSSSPHLKKNNTSSTMSFINASPPPLSRDQRLFRRNRKEVTDKELKGIKTVRVIIAQDEPEVINLIGMRKPTKVKLKDDIMQGHYYKVPFGRLTMRQRRIRMREVSKMILGGCMNRNDFQKKRRTNVGEKLDHELAAGNPLPDGNSNNNVSTAKSKITPA